LDVRWTSLAEKAKRNRTVFAQRRLKPEDVMPEWQRTQRVLGSSDDVQRFVMRSLTRLDAAPDRLARGARVPLHALQDEALKERLEADGLTGSLRIDFDPAPAPGAQFVHRSHPLVTVLAEDLLERALDEQADGASPARLGRAAVWRSTAVEKQTTILLLRLRHQLTWTREAHTRVLLVEEALPVAVTGREPPSFVTGSEVLEWLDSPADSDLSPAAQDRVLTAVLEGLDVSRPGLEDVAAQQAEILLADHRRVRSAGEARGRYEVRALTPVDVIAVCVLVPAA
jgi:hypothetical protein